VKKRKVPPPRADEGKATEKRSTLLRRLLGGLKPGKALPPAGKRSGEGIDSLEPFLEQERNTRPGPLE
jgi:hypothetical protein